MQFIFLGPPGADIGRQASTLANRWEIPLISMSDILRAAIAGKTSLGIQARTYVETGELVPDILVMASMWEYFEHSNLTLGYILEGFPRTLSQACALDELLSIFKQPSPRVVYFETTAETLVERLLAKGRQDDTKDTICRRLEVHQEHISPLLDFYRQRDCLTTIDGNLAQEEITNVLQGLGVPSLMSSAADLDEYYAVTTKLAGAR